MNESSNKAGTAGIALKASMPAGHVLPDRVSWQQCRRGCRMIPVQEIIAYGMEWTPLQYERQEVNAAGRCLIADEAGNLSMPHGYMLEIINNWRSVHSFPLQVLKMMLLRRAKDLDEKAIVAQRLSSIDAKLRKHSKWMKLTQMQDIGGCRAIVSNVSRLKLLIKAYKSGHGEKSDKRARTPQNKRLHH